MTDLRSKTERVPGQPELELTAGTVITLNLEPEYSHNMFIDEVTLRVCGGKGGDGCASFRREKYIPRGGPNGGNGGNGGSVYLRADNNLSTLLDFASRPTYAAGKGKPGSGNDRDGRNGEDIMLNVPPGTIVHDADTGFVLRDLTEHDERVCVAAGGHGGRGNKHFATPTHRAPREFEYGKEGEQRTLRLELKLIADVGLVGLPNAGKSTLLSRISSAHPKIADYPFTTLKPQLGIVETHDARTVVVADLPGLIKGAHLGHGLGDEFLRHIERTRVICQVVDMAPISGPEPVTAYNTIRDELRLYSSDLAAKPHIIAANKLDLTDAEENTTAFRKHVSAQVYPISAVSGAGIRELIHALSKEIDKCS